MLDTSLQPLRHLFGVFPGIPPHTHVSRAKCLICQCGIATPAASGPLLAPARGTFRQDQNRLCSAQGAAPAAGSRLSSSPRQDVDRDREADAEGCQRGLGFLVDGSHADREHQERGHDDLSHQDGGDLLIGHDAAEGSSGGVGVVLVRRHGLWWGELCLCPPRSILWAFTDICAHRQDSVGGHSSGLKRS